MCSPSPTPTRPRHRCAKSCAPPSSRRWGRAAIPPNAPASRNSSPPCPWPTSARCTSFARASSAPISIWMTSIPPSASWGPTTRSAKRSPPAPSTRRSTRPIGKAARSSSCSFPIIIARRAIFSCAAPSVRWMRRCVRWAIPNSALPRRATFPSSGSLRRSCRDTAERSPRSMPGLRSSPPRLRETNRAKGCAPCSRRR